MTKSNYEILTEAQELIRDPAHWTQDAYARNADMNAIDDIHSLTATCWCSVGAILKVAGLSSDVIDHPAFALIEDYADGLAITAFNDSHTHWDVMAAFDHARELARVSAA